MRAGVVALAKDADLLIYDTQFTYDEYRLRPHWGHSHPDDAIAIARDAKRQAAVPVPPRADALRRRQRRDPRAVPRASSRRPTTRFELVSAYEGLEIALGRRRMKIRFWGVRGSIPAPGPETNPLRRQHRRASRSTTARRRARHHRHGHRAHAPRQRADGGRVRQGHGPRDDPALAHALGSHPGPRLLRAGVHRRQPVHGVGPGRLAGRARGHPRGPDGSELLAAADAQELLARRSTSARRRCGEPFEAEGLHSHGARAPARRDHRARVPHRGGRPHVRVRLRRRPAGRGAARRRTRSRSTAAPTCCSTTRRTGPSDQATRRNRGFSSYEDAAARRGRREGQAAGHVPLRPGLHATTTSTTLVASCRAALDGRGGTAIDLVPAREGDELEI